ncbi:MAG: RNA polymerase subunit sigma-70 [Betaproteobacteria bacterium]
MPSSSPLAHNVNRLSHLDLPGAGQVLVDGSYAYVGHITNPQGLGTSIIDVSDPKAPRIVSQIPVGDGTSHAHKARVVGDLMITNMEQNMTAIGRKADELPKLRVSLKNELGRVPTHAELAAKLGVDASEIPAVEAMEKTPYSQGGFKIWDIKDRTHPKLITHHKTHGRGVHRFDMDANYAYISTEMPGYIGNILVIYDLKQPSQPEEISRWWIPGQHIAGGEKPTWSGRQHRLHHTVRVGNRLFAGCWHGGVRVVDVQDITKPQTIGAYNYHPPFPEPSHTFMGLTKKINGRDIAVAIDEEDHAHSAAEMAQRRGRPHGALWTFDITDVADIKPLAMFEVSELDSPWSRTAPGRFGAHQFQEHMKGGDTLIYCAWFSGGLRIVDIANPSAPDEIGWYIPQPCGKNTSPQTNDVDVDDRGLIYIVDRYLGFDILQLKR